MTAGMKILTAAQMRDIEKKAYAEGFSEESFMEQAGKSIAEASAQYATDNKLSKNILILCAKGNNSGDAYVAGRYLLKKGYQITALQTIPLSEATPLCKKNHQQFLEAGGKVVEELRTFESFSIILDGLFGTGFKGTLPQSLIPHVKAVNDSKIPIIAIDIPSGLNGDTGIAEGTVIKATKTLFLGAPKTGFFINDGWNLVGKLQYVDFGLPSKYLESIQPEMLLLTRKLLQSIIPPIQRNWHKYERGYVTGLAGSKDMPGASILSSWSALTAGAGIVRLIHPEGMEAELASAPVELVRQSYNIDHLEPIIESMNKSTASFIGPGIGRSVQVLEVLKYVLKNIQKPSVIDADALTLIAENNLKVPEGVILTPHHGEMLRLLKKEKQPLKTEDLLKLSQDYVNKTPITLVLKGAPTFILQSGMPIYVNPTGDPGMATAGSGDVLTGMIAAMLSHKLSPHDAAILSVFMHGLAGEYAAKEKTSHCVLASDLIHQFPNVYRELA